MYTTMQQWKFIGFSSCIGKCEGKFFARRFWENLKKSSVCKHVLKENVMNTTKISILPTVKKERIFF